MGILRSAAVVAMSAAMMLTGCRDGDSVDGSSSTTSTSQSSSVSSKPTKTIKSVDLRNATWRGLRGNSSGEATFKNGKADEASSAGVGRVTYELHAPTGGQPTYVDADGDGDLDAVLRVESVEGNGWMAEEFVWLWDSKRQKAVQKRKPIYIDLRCDDHLTDKVVFDGAGTATVSYRTKKPEEPCAAEPTIPQSRVITMKGAFAPYQLKPFPSSLDSCTPELGSGDVYFPEDLAANIRGFRAAPSDGAPVIVPKGDIRMWNAADGTRFPNGGEWMLVWYMPKAKKLSSDKDEFPCGWLKRAE